LPAPLTSKEFESYEEEKRTRREGKGERAAPISNLISMTEPGRGGKGREDVERGEGDLCNAWLPSFWPSPRIEKKKGGGRGGQP